MAAPAVAGWLLALAWPLAKRVLVALGIGAITYGGLSLIGNQIQSHVVSAWGAMPASALQIATLSGFSEAVGITLGAFTARIALVAAAKLGMLSK